MDITVGITTESGTDFYDRTTLKSLKTGFEISADGEELPYNTMEVVVDMGQLVPAHALLRSMPEHATAFTNAMPEDFDKYKYGDKVKLVCNTYTVCGMYVKKVKRVGPTYLQLDCVNVVGMLDMSTHYGGVYTGEPAKTLIADIVGNFANTVVDDEIADVPMYGWLPVATRRENLHQVLFALGAYLAPESLETVTVRSNSYMETRQVGIPVERVYTGGTVDYMEPFTSITVTEHAYSKGVATKETSLYTGATESTLVKTPKGKQVRGSIVTFKQPVYDIVVKDGTLLESGPNYVVLGPAASCTVVGKKYEHNEQLISRYPVKAVPYGAVPNDITVSDATLVNFANSASVAARLVAYYSATKRVKLTASMNWVFALPGSQITTVDPYNNYITGTLLSQNDTYSSVAKSAMDILVDFTPGAPGNYYKNSVVLTTDQTWKVPSTLENPYIRVVLIGGGCDGTAGTDGQDSTQSDNPGASSTAIPGAGGKAGKPGSGGLIHVVTVPVLANQPFPVHIGQSAPYGSRSPATTFGNYSSEKGIASENGFTDIFSNVAYGVAGMPGFDGGDGGANRVDGESAGPYAGGKTVSDWTYCVDADCRNRYDGTSTGGGGAAYGEAGTDARKGTRYNKVGTAGSGGNAIPGENAVTYGSGGSAGHGGGGAGAPALVEHTNATFGQFSYEFSVPGKPGKGSAPGLGKPGCVIVYY